MTDHQVTVEARDHWPLPPWLHVTCSCGAELAQLGKARPGELWELEQAHRVAMAVAGPTPAVHWGTHVADPTPAVHLATGWDEWDDGTITPSRPMETPTAPPTTPPTALG